MLETFLACLPFILIFWSCHMDATRFGVFIPSGRFVCVDKLYNKSGLFKAENQRNSMVGCEALLASKTKLGYKSVACLMRVRIVLIQFDFQFSVVDNAVKQKVPSIEDMCGFAAKQPLHLARTVEM
jgi:hypothetical protein